MELKRRTVHIKETFASIIAEEPYIPAGIAEIVRQRHLLEVYIRKDPGFQASLEPRAVREDAPMIAARMAEAASRAGVGPMAAVAGAIAEFSLKAMLRAGATHAVVDNGGDIALALSHPLIVGLFTGPSPVKDLGLRVEPRPETFGICTSSGTVGHSLSFGRADAATVIAEDVCLADAVATSLGNAVQDADPARLKAAMKNAWVDGVEGMIVVIDDLLASWGNVPEIVPVRLNINKISGEKAPRRCP